MNAYRRESQKQKLMVRKAKVCEAKLLFVVTAFSKLVGDENFVTLLRAESLDTMPKPLWEKLSSRSDVGQRGKPLQPNEGQSICALGAGRNDAEAV